MAEPLRLLHLSDLHVRSDADAEALLQPLAADLGDEEGLAVQRLDGLVVSGDITNRATPGEFEAARRFLAALMTRFGVTAERVVLVPGNHDLSWDEPVYQYKAARQVDVKRLAEGSYKAEGGGYLVRDDARYPERFGNFARGLYQPLVQQEYPLPATEQGLSILIADVGLQLLAFNSAWQIDEHWKERSGIHDGALSRCLVRADEQLAGAGLAPTQALRIAVWHHPVTGNEKIEDDAFLERLRVAGVKLCLHGHIHEERADLVGYLHPTRRLHVAGAGSFGAPASDRPASTPQLYNLLEIDRAHRTIRVHTRQRPRGGGAWHGWAAWPGAGRHEQRSYYDIELPAPPSARAATVAPPVAEDAEADVLFCYNGEDEAAVRAIEARLGERGIRAWRKGRDIRPGAPIQRAVEEQLGRTRAAAVFIGRRGLEGWQGLEQMALLNQYAARGLLVIAVILADCPPGTLRLPSLLGVLEPVDLRVSDPDPIDRLVLGITAQRR